MYTSIENVKITEVEIETGKYKGDKFVRFEKPIEKDKKVVFEDGYSNLMEVVSEIKHASERRPDRLIRVSFDVTAEW